MQWVDSSDLEPEAQTLRPREYHAAWQALCSAKGILVPGGFGLRGTEGMIVAAKWAREQKVPYLGICLGFQIAVIEFARSVLGIAGASDWLPSVLALPTGCLAIAHASQLLVMRYIHRSRAFS